MIPSTTLLLFTDVQIVTILYTLSHLIEIKTFHSEKSTYLRGSSRSTQLSVKYHSLALMIIMCWKLSSSFAFLFWICSVNVLFSFILQHHRHHLRRINTRKHCEFTYDDYKLSPIVPSDKLQELNNKLSKQQHNNSVVEVRRYRIGNTTETSAYKYIHSTNITAMTNATLDEKFKELVEPLLDLELVAKTIEDWSRPLPTNYLTQPLVFVGPSGVGKGNEYIHCSILI